MSTDALFSDEFPLCCKATVLNGFPEGDRSHRSMVANEGMLRRELQKFMDYAFKRGHAVIVATLNSDQKLAAKVLEDMGWHSSASMKKMNYPEGVYTGQKEIRLWWCQLDEYEWVD
ncbi:hypothetical protein KC963_00835 [Candidatus Saccharibacteria bacterium]|nr:hypothetical protein [Candidatus Saccharibacteria bacterium]